MTIVVLDIETAGDGPLGPNEFALQPWSPRFRITQVALGWIRAGQVGSTSLPTEHLEKVVAATLEQIAASRLTIYGWNVVFDIAGLMSLSERICKLCYRVKWADTMLLYRHLTNNRMRRPYDDSDDEVEFGTYALEDVAVSVLGVQSWKSQEIYEGADAEARERLNRMDVEMTARLTEVVLERLSPRWPAVAAAESACLPAIAEANLRGVRMDRQAIVQLAETCRKAMRTQLAELRADNPHLTDEVLRSPKQLGRLIYDNWGLPPADYTATGAPSTAKGTLARMALHDERIRRILAYKEAATGLAKFCASPMASLDYHGGDRTYPSASVFGTYTGRVTYGSKIRVGRKTVPTGVALHQWKRSPEYRRLILPDEGHCIVEHDFAGQEFRWMAHYSQDAQMIALCQPGEDAHAYMGAMIGGYDYHEFQRMLKNGDPEAKKLRQLGKVGNLSLQYRTSATTLQLVALKDYGLSLTLAEARSICDAHRRAYPGIAHYWRRQCTIARYERDGIVTIGGRRVYLPGAYSAEQGWADESTAINAPIQGSGADQKYLALRHVLPLLKECGGRFLMDLHDGIYFSIPEDKVKTFAVESARIICELPYKQDFGSDVAVQFPVDTKIGINWGSMETLNE